jgi:hypothetical protein
MNSTVQGILDVSFKAQGDDFPNLFGPDKGVYQNLSANAAEIILRHS